MTIRQDVSILIEVPDSEDLDEIGRAGGNWIYNTLRETDAVDWSCGETFKDDYLP